MESKEECKIRLGIPLDYRPALVDCISTGQSKKRNKKTLTEQEVESAIFHLNDIENMCGVNGPTVALRHIIERLR